MKENAPDRIIKELSDEELLEIAKGGRTPVTATKISEAGKFIYALDIQEGRTKITSQMVYHTYKLWKGWDSKFQSRGHFFRMFNKYFTPDRDKNGRFYWLNPEPFDLSQENYWLMRKDVRYEKQKRKKSQE